jgi:UPF0755 protein
VTRAPRPAPRRKKASRRATPVSPLTAARRWVVTTLSGAATFGVVLLLALLWAFWAYQGPGPAAKAGPSTIVALRKGAGLQEIAASLQRGGVVRSRSVFVAAAQLTGSARRLKAGEYEFPSRASMAAVMGKIKSGKVVRRQITIPEGTPIDVVMDMLAQNPVLSGVAPTPPEGSILPETYDIQRGEDRAAVLRRMMDARDKLLATLWNNRADGLPYKSPEEAVILASVVEKETGLASERPRIAAVFLNRLAAGMRLESDPTIIYGLTRGRPLGRGIRLSELTADTPYNTYKIDGLPPTPICNPGRAALAAALDPPRSDELFFVANGSGGHVFSSTFEAHKANVDKWRAIEAQKAATGQATATDTSTPVPQAAAPQAKGRRK